MSDDSATQKKKLGRKSSEVAKGRHQSLADRNAEVIKLIKVVAGADVTASKIPESAARELLDRRRTFRGHRA